MRVYRCDRHVRLRVIQYYALKELCNSSVSLDSIFAGEGVALQDQRWTLNRKRWLIPIIFGPLFPKSVKSRSAESRVDCERMCMCVCVCIHTYTRKFASLSFKSHISRIAPWKCWATAETCSREGCILLTYRLLCMWKSVLMIITLKIIQ